MIASLLLQRVIQNTRHHRRHTLAKRTRAAVVTATLHHRARILIPVIKRHPIHLRRRRLLLEVIQQIMKRMSRHH